MPAREMKQTQTGQESRYGPSTATVESEPARTREHTLSQQKGLSFSRMIEDDVKGSLEAVGQVCQAVLLGGLSLSVAGGLILVYVLLP